MDGNGCSIGTHILSYKPEAPQRTSAQQADPLTAHRSNPEYLQIESTLWIGKAVCTLLEFLLVCLHAALELLCILGRR